MTVLVPDPTIRAMDDQLGSVVLGDLPTDLDGLLLSRHDHGRALPTFAFHRPVVSVRDYMLVLLCHLRSVFARRAIFIEILTLSCSTSEC